MKDAPSSRVQKIVIAEDGPYIVSGSVPLAVQVITPNEEGLSWDWVEGKSVRWAAKDNLCGCGRSKTKPFCDGTHAAIGFDGEETASRVPLARQSETYDGPTMPLSDAEELCAFARFCDPGGKIWSLIEATDHPGAGELVIREAMRGPAGRLVLHDKKTHKDLEEPLPPSIGVVDDPVPGWSGPLWVRGGLTIEAADGTRHETRNR